MVAMIAVETQIPEDIFLTLQARGLFKDVLAERSRQLLAIRFYQDRTLSLGKAARLAGMTLWDFAEFLSTNHVPVIDHTEEELAIEFDAVAQLSEELGA